MGIKMEIIRVESLEKVYKIPVRRQGFLNSFRDLVNKKWVPKVAIKDINLSVNAGEIVGYIGPNGAGKSTTIKIISGVLHPTSGKVLVNGIVPYKNRIENAKRIALIAGQKSNLYWDLPVIDTFELMKRIYKISPEQYKKNLSMFNDLMAIGQLLDVPARQLSLGQRVRADIVAALLHNPDIVYLDEPTIGLDIVAKDRVREFIMAVNQERGTTFIITSHDITDIERMCHKINVIDNGSLIYSGNIENLKNKYNSKKNVVRVLLDSDIGSLELQNCVVSKEDEYFNIQFDKINNSASAVLTELLESGYRIRDISINEQGLEDVVKEIYNASSSYKSM